MQDLLGSGRELDFILGVMGHHRVFTVASMWRADGRLEFSPEMMEA